MHKTLVKRYTQNPTFKNAMNVFFLPEDQDSFARSMGWQDMEQMAHYESQGSEVLPMTDREVEQLVEREESTVTIVDGTVEYLAPPPSEILVLARQDSREIYEDDEACSLALLSDSMDLAGVY